MSNAFELIQDGGSASSDAYLVGRSHNNPTFSNLGYTGTLTGGTGIVNIGSGQIYKDAAGNVGIGTNNPIAWNSGSTEISLGKDTDANGAVIHFNGDLGGIWATQSTSTLSIGGFGGGGLELTGGAGGGGIRFSAGSGSAPERLRITADGNVGIGTSSPANKFEVRHNANTAQYAFFENINTGTNSESTLVLKVPNGFLSFGAYNGTSGTGYESYIYSTGLLDLYAGGSKRLRITADGNVCIGATTPQYGYEKIYTYAASGDTWNTIRSDSLANGQGVGHEANYANYTRFVQLLVCKHSGITNPAGVLGLSAEGGTHYYLWPDNSGVFRTSTAQTNIGTTGGTVVGAQTSDERLKNITGPVPYGLDEVLALEPIAYAMKSEPDVLKIGFSAQQVLPIIPESVFDTDEELEPGEPTKLGMEYVSLIPVLVNAIKELNEELQTLKARIN